MNENSVPSTRKKVDYIVLHILPPQRCFYCPRLSTIGIIDSAFNPNFLAVCPLHGYAQTSNADESPAELAMRDESVRRFDLWMFGDRGSIPVVSPVVDLNSIAGYLPDEGAMVAEVAYFVTHEDDEGTRQEAHVVWSFDEDKFYLFRDGAMVEMREGERVA